MKEFLSDILFLLASGSAALLAAGCALLLGAGKELVLLFCKHLGNGEGETWKTYLGPMVSFRLEAIQNIINEWEGTDAYLYQIVPFDLSGYGGIVNQ